MKAVKYVATLPHVREVSIVGTADLGFWADRLRSEGLAPLESDGRARILIIAADSRFLNVSFQELSISIFLSPGGAFLTQAFNSRRSFAFCEYRLFGTPYAFGKVHVSATLPASVRLTHQQELLFRAEMGSGIVPPESPPHQDGWDGPIFLPSRREGEGSSRLFFAKIHGATQPAVFQPSRDVLEIRPSRKFPVFQALIDSRFEATEWLVRQDAMHMKSKTYPISEFAGASHD